MNETSKAMRRRWCEHERGPILWRDMFRGRGIDIGCGPDKVPFDECVGFDEKDGDANKLEQFFEPASFDYIHSSQSLEHMHDPKVLWSWMKLLKPGGHAIVTVPSWELYEGMRWPSVYNPDHKSTWSMNLRGSPAKHHVHVPTFVASQPGFATPILARQLDVNYDYKVGVTRDQTFAEDAGVEPWIEFVLRKL